MNPRDVAVLLAENELGISQTAPPELEAVRLAILVEDALGITLSDADIDAGLLAEPGTLARLLGRQHPGAA